MLPMFLTIPDDTKHIITDTTNTLYKVEKTIQYSKKDLFEININYPKYVINKTPFTLTNIINKHNFITGHDLNINQNNLDDIITLNIHDTNAEQKVRSLYWTGYDFN